jgi:hypothetical protein
MRTIALGFALMGLGSGVGCVTLQPVGPFASKLASPTGPKPAPTGSPATAAPVLPPLQPAPAPVPPALLVTPGEVTEANHKQSVRRLIEEMEADRKAMESMPRTAEVSVIKGK